MPPPNATVPDAGWARDRIADLVALLEDAGYRGHDPFDLPNAPALRWVRPDRVLPQLALSRFGSRIAPDWLRRALRVPPIEDPKIYVCAYFAYRLLGEAHAARADEMIARLARVAVREGDGAYWGYDYTWATREGVVNPRGASTLVPGAFAMLTLGHHHLRGDDPDLADLLGAAARYYARTHLRDGRDGPFLGYFARSTSNTHNANLLGAAALTVAGTLLGEDDWRAVGAAAAETSARAVDERGWIPYRDDRAGQWTDAFHHVYSLACLRVLAAANPHVDRARFAETADRMERFLRTRFFLADGSLCYRPGEPYPVDPHNHAVVALGLHLLDGPSAAAAVLAAADARCWDARRRRYVYRVHPRRRDRRLFLRWTQAWMLVSLAAIVRPDAVRAELARWRVVEAAA